MTPTAPLLVAALVLAACARPDAPPDAATATADSLAVADGPPFLGTAWRLAAIDGEPPDGLPGGQALVTVAFTDRPFGDLAPQSWSLGGYDGCNEFGQAYDLDGDPASTEGAGFRAGAVLSDAMACGAPGEHVSDRLNLGLAASRRVRLSGDRLTFTDSLGAERAAFVPRPARPVDSAAVVAGRWRLDPAASDVPTAYGLAPARYTVAFGPDGTYTGQAGCVAFTGDYALDGGRLTVSSFSRDDAACDGPSPWTGPYGLETGDVEADTDRLVLYLRSGGRAVFARPD